MTEKPLIRIVDDDEALRDALSYTVESEQWESAAFSDAESFLAGDSPSRPGVLILDFKMQGMNGLELYKILNERDYSVPVIFLTAHGDVDMAVTALRSGAFHFLQKPVSREKLLCAIQEALDSRDAKRRSESCDLVAGLTAREMEIAQMLAQGSTNRDVAESLGLSVRTVENYHAMIYRKLHVDSVEGISLCLREAGSCLQSKLPK